MYDNLTFLMCLPRSRSAWLCEFLKPIAITMHDPLKQCRDIEELAQIIPVDRSVFVGDTAAILFYEQIVPRFPGARYLFVSRGYEEVKQSLRQCGVTTDTLHDATQALIPAWNAVHQHGAEYRYVLYSNLDNELTDIWQFVGGRTLNLEYVQRMISTNIQTPMKQNIDLNKVTALFGTRHEYPTGKLLS